MTEATWHKGSRLPGEQLFGGREGRDRRIKITKKPHMKINRLPMARISTSTAVQFSSVTQSCMTRCDPKIAAHQASLSATNSQSSLKLTSIESVMPSSHLILCRLLLLLPPIPPSIRVFSNESTL